MKYTLSFSGKRIQQIHESEEIKYSAEEKEIEESESDEECVKRSVAERRDKIVKRLSVERQIPASSQKKEISREITEIKRKSLIDDKKAIHESEIMMQLPADNIVKSAVVPEQVIKMKMGKMDSSEVSKSDFDKELTHKFKTSSRSSEDDDDSSSAQKSLSQEDVDNLKIIKDISSVEMPSKIIDSLKSEMPSLASGTKQLTQDFLAFEKFTQLPSQTTTTAVPEKFVGEVREKQDESKLNEELVETAQEIVSETVETASKKVESIISAFESPKPANGFAEHTKLPAKDIVDTATHIQDVISAEQNKTAAEAKSFIETKADETKHFILTESESVKDKIKAFSEPKIVDAKDHISQLEADLGKAKESVEQQSSTTVQSVKIASATMQDKLGSGFDKLGQMFGDAKDAVVTEVQGASESIETTMSEAKSETKEKLQEGIAETKSVVESMKTFAEDKIDDGKTAVKTETNNVAETIKSFSDKTETAFDDIQSKAEEQQKIVSDKIGETIADFEAKKVTYGLEQKIGSAKEGETKAPEAAPRKIMTTTEQTFDDSLGKLEEMKSIVADARKITHDFLSMEQDSQLPLPLSKTEEIKSIEKTTVETITFPPIVESAPIKDEIVSKASETLLSAKHDIETKVHETKQILGDGIEVAAPITRPEITTTTVKDITRDFLSFEQTGPIHHSAAQVSVASDVSIEPRKSLTDAEFCKSVEETITKKMSEGLIEISEELKLQGMYPITPRTTEIQIYFIPSNSPLDTFIFSPPLSLSTETDIPHSQTPPPTPIDTKNDKSEYVEQIQKPSIDEGEHK